MVTRTIERIAMERMSSSKVNPVCELTQYLKPFLGWFIKGKISFDTMLQLFFFFFDCLKRSQCYTLFLVSFHPGDNRLHTEHLQGKELIELLFFLAGPLLLFVILIRLYAHIPGVTIIEGSGCLPFLHLFRELVFLKYLFGID